jgi:hypothetical protein
MFLKGSVPTKIHVVKKQFYSKGPFSLNATIVTLLFLANASSPYANVRVCKYANTRTRSIYKKTSWYPLTLSDLVLCLITTKGPLCPWKYCWFNIFLVFFKGPRLLSCLANYMVSSFFCKICWSSQRESNPRSRDWEPRAIPLYQAGARCFHWK